MFSYYDRDVPSNSGNDPLKSLLDMDAMQKRGILIKLVSLTLFCVHHYKTLLSILFLSFKTSYCKYSTIFFTPVTEKKENKHDAS
jgi:hypothetical protein